MPGHNYECVDPVTIRFANYIAKAEQTASLLCVCTQPVVNKM